MEEREICNARIASCIPWITEVSIPLALEAAPNNYTTAAVTTRFQKQVKKCDIIKPTLINTNLLYYDRQCTFCKKVGHNVQTYIKKHKTLNYVNNCIQASLNNILIVDEYLTDRK